MLDVHPKTYIKLADTVQFLSVLFQGLNKIALGKGKLGCIAKYCSTYFMLL